MPDWTELVEMFLDYLTGDGKSDATVVKYGGLLKRLPTWWKVKGKRRPTSSHPLQATPQDLELVTTTIAHQQGLRPRSRRPLIAAVRMFYRWAHRMEYIQADPSRGLRYPDYGRPLPVAMTLTNAEKLLMQPDISTFQGLRDAAILATFIGGGLRVSELEAMNEGHLLWILDEGRRERLVLRVLGKRQRERLVPMPVELGLLVRAYLGHDELDQVDRTLDDGDKVLWISVRNRTVPPHEYHGEARRLAARSIRDLLVAYGEAAEIPRRELHPHALRHLYGTELGEEDIDLVRSKALMGHASDQSHEIYRHLAYRKLTQAADQANPLGKMRGPLLERIRDLDRRLRE